MKRIRLLAVIEAATVTGPAKNLLQFGSLACSADPPVDVTIASFRRPGQPEIFGKAAAAAGLPLHYIEERGRFDRAVVGQLAALVRELRPDIVQSHAVKSHFLVRQAGVNRLLPWAAFHHGYTWPTLTARLYNQLDRWSLGAAARVLTVSLPFRDELIRKGVAARRIEIIHNAVDPDWGAPHRQPESPQELRDRMGIPDGRKVALIVGRLSREKDHATLLDAIRILRAGEVPAIHLLVIGGGPERARIEQRIRELSLEDRVTLTGEKPSEPFYTVADVAVLSSLSEGSPNALLEAMAARLPVVATNVGGIPEIVADGKSALLVPPRDSAAMAAAIGALLRDSTLACRLSAAAREIITLHHTPEARTERLAWIYRGMLDRT